MKITTLLPILMLFAACNHITVTHDNEVHILDQPSQIESTVYQQLSDSFNLDGIGVAEQQLGSLSPKYPIAGGRRNGYGLPALYTDGCLNPMAYSMIVKVDSMYKIVSSLTDLKELFAPIESKEEALSYALACTGLDALYEFKIGKDFRTFVNTINTTSVVEKKEAYEVNLFDYQLCGCGPHSHFMVVFTVKKNGDIIQTNKIKLYEDPLQDGLCVD